MTLLNKQIHFAKVLLFGLNLLLSSCHPKIPSAKLMVATEPANMLDYVGTPNTARDRNALAFSDQGAWFAYGFPADTACFGGFTGPFLMTQENGVWSSQVLSQLMLKEVTTGQLIDWNGFAASHTSFNSHLAQAFVNEQFRITQTLCFASAHSTLITTQITNLSGETIRLQPHWRGTVFLPGLKLAREGNTVVLQSPLSAAKGTIQSFGEPVTSLELTDSTYALHLDPFALKPGETRQLVLGHTFIFPEYNGEEEQRRLGDAVNQLPALLDTRKAEKGHQLATLHAQLDTPWQDSVYQDLVAKTILTLQNNWRIPAGELKNSGVFPSYHYIWFHGFWAWDSWKHAVALTQYDPELAKEQIRAMYAYLTPEGFIPDCIYRDTTIEAHNYRNTKPPLSAWAAWEVYTQSQDVRFLKELYPKIVRQHTWWYTNRDHDQDGLCEYGSTDGSLVAAKWESGMDNAVRFDQSKILKNSATAYSLDQESVDLNAYLYTEKQYLRQMAEVLNKPQDQEQWATQARVLKAKIQFQFYDPNTGWFYDTSIDGQSFIQVMGCEGWIPLWAEIATPAQAVAVKNSMINSAYFFTRVPLPTLAANHPKFTPADGYWRGPVWLDQAYFGVKGLHNYGFHQEAYAATYALLQQAEGVLTKGKSIRENYQPITGQGLESKNFSWSAAHYLLLLLNR
ncbi:MAG: trehalase [Lewinellaceae bacterium]|nr:trehalase [Lewinellaceae bacterium]